MPEKSPSSINKLHRRAFIQYSGVLAGGFAVSPLFGQFSVRKGSALNAEFFWYQKPLRIMHTVLREIDATTYDANAVVSYLKKGNYNTLCVNAGGIVDFFQNPLPAANVNQIMGNRDILKEIAIACKNAGIKVIARVDFRGWKNMCTKSSLAGLKKMRHKILSKQTIPTRSCMSPAT